MRMFGADHPHQATQPGLLQVGAVVGQHRLGVPGHDVQARRFAGELRQLAGDAHQMMHVLAAEQRSILIGVAGLAVRSGRPRR